MNSFAIFLTHTKQNLKFSLSLIIAALLMGAVLGISFKANNKIKSLAKPLNWGTQMAILPKGITLEQLEQELTTGKVTSLIPQAMFDTTVDLTKGALRMSAVLPGHDATGTFLMLQGSDNVNLAWSGQRIKTWENQNEFSTPEWGNKVIAAAFASGGFENLTKLKDLIDRKTVAQAVWIEDAQKSSLANQAMISNLALMAEAIMIVSLLISIYLATSWLYDSHLSTRQCLQDIGYTNSDFTKLQVLTVFLLIISPVLVGLFLSAGITF